MARRCFCGCGRTIPVYRLRLRAYDRQGKRVSVTLARMQARARCEPDELLIASLSVKGQEIASEIAAVVHRERDPWLLDDQAIRAWLTDAKTLEGARAGRPDTQQGPT